MKVLRKQQRVGSLLESGVAKGKGQRKSLGQMDVRYQLKTLESASVMDTDDFFAGDFSKQVQPDMFVSNPSNKEQDPAQPTEEDTDMIEEESTNNQQNG